MASPAPEPARDYLAIEAKKIFIHSLQRIEETKKLPDLQQLWGEVREKLGAYNVWDLQDMRDALLQTSKLINRSIKSYVKDQENGEQEAWRKHSTFCYQAFQILGFIQRRIDTLVDKSDWRDFDDLSGPDFSNDDDRA